MNSKVPDGMLPCLVVDKNNHRAHLGPLDLLELTMRWFKDESSDSFQHFVGWGVFHESETEPFLVEIFDAKTKVRRAMCQIY